MTKLREKAQAKTLQIVGEMIGDRQMVDEGKEEEYRADHNNGSDEWPTDSAQQTHSER